MRRLALETSRLWPDRATARPTAHSSLSPTPDNLVEGPQLAVMTPSGSTLSGQVTYTANSVTITDANIATVSFQSAGTTVGEDGGAVNLVLVSDDSSGRYLREQRYLYRQGYQWVSQQRRLRCDCLSQDGDVHSRARQQLYADGQLHSQQ